MSARDISDANERPRRHAVRRGRTDDDGEALPTGDADGLLEGVPVGLYRTSPAGRILYANPALVTMLGYRDCAALMAVNANDLYVDPSERAGRLEKLAQTGVALGAELEIRREDGTHIWMRDCARVVRDTEGQVLCYEGCLEDITQCKQAEDELRRHRVQLEELVEQRTTTLAQLNEQLRQELAEKRRIEAALRRKDSVLEAVSHVAERFLRQGDWRRGIGDVLARLGRAAQVSRACIFELQADSDGGLRPRRRHEWVVPGAKPLSDSPDSVGEPCVPENAKRWVEQLARGNVVCGDVGDLPSGEREALAARGVRSLAVVPILADARLWGFMAFCECAREREWSPAEVEALNTAADAIGAAIQRDATEQALHDSDVRFQQLAENIREAFWLYEPRTGKSLYASPACERIWGHSVEWLHTQPHAWQQAVHPDDRARVAADVERQKQGTATEHEYRMVRPDGTVRHVRSRAFPVLDENGQVYRVAGLTEDITERKRAEQALRESAELFGTVVNASKDAMIALDHDGRITIFNPAAEELFGHRCEEMLGQPLDRLLPEEYRADHQSYVKDYFTTGSPRGALGRTLELPALRSDGTRFPIELSLSAGQREGRPFVLAVIRDITARKQAEEELRKFKTISDQAAYGAAMADLDGNLTYLNSAFAEMHGYTDRELVGQNLSVFHTEQQMPHVNELGARLKAEGAYVGEEVWHVRRDGVVFPTLMNATIIRDEDGRPLLLSATAIDITKRKRAEDASRESERRFRAIFDQTFQLIGLMKPDGTVIEANRTALGVVGVNEHEVLGKPFWETPWWTHSAEAQDRLRDAVRKAAAGQFIRFETTHPDADGNLRQIDFSLKPVKDEAGRVSLLIPEGRDITELKRAEQVAREHREQLAHVARVGTLGEMTSGLAHELSPRLAAMMYYAKGCITHLQRGVWGVNEAIGGMEKIAGEAERAGEFIRHLRTFVRRHPAHRSCGALNPIIRQVVSFADYEARDRRVAIRLDLAEPLPDVVIDAIQIEQVVLNLVRNGIEALANTSVEQRELRIRTLVDRQGRVQVAVEDNGPGLEPEMLRRAFDAFFTTRPQGLGLGLSISRSIIEAHEGKIWAEAPAGGGAAFRFVLPAAEGDDHDAS